MLLGFSYREKDPNYNIYEQQFRKKHHWPIRQKKKVVVTLFNALFGKCLDADKQKLVQKFEATHRESIKQM